MNQLKRRFYILGLSLLVLIVALAGLLGVLDSLPQPASSTPDIANTNQPAVSQRPDDGKKPGETPPQPSANETAPSASLSPKFSLSLPESFSLDLSKATNPGLSLEAAAPPHIPVLDVTGAENTEYLKSITSSYFDGVEWIMEDLGEYIQYNGEVTIPEGINPDQIAVDNITVATLVDIVNGKVAIPTSLYPVSVNSTEPLLYFPDDMTFLTEEEFPEEYMFETIHFIFDRQTLANAELDSIEKYLQLPDNITPRTYELADNITGGIESSFLMAKALEDYLKTSYSYDFEAEAAPEGWEPNDWFLFESKSGVCTNFNSAFVILARAAGIPARLAGGFAISPKAGEQVVYTDQAHAWSEVKFKDLGWYNFDATGSAPALIATVTEVTSAGPITRKGQEFNVAGTVWTKTGLPAEGALVEILVNDRKDAEGATLIGKGIVTEGHFSIQAVIPGEMAVGEYQVLAHSVKSARYSESWSDPKIKVISGTNIGLQFAPRIKTGGTLAINGILTGEFGEPLAGQKLEIQVNGKAAANPVTDKDGKFTWKKDYTDAGKHLLKVSYTGTEYFLASSRNTEFYVLAPAVLELKADGNVINDPVAVSGRLTEETTGDALPNRALAVSIDGVVQDLNLITNDSGRFSFKHTFDKLGGHRLEVKYTGDPEYYDTSAALDIEVIPTSTAFPWKIIIIALAIAAAGVGGWCLYRWLKKRPTRPADTTVEAKESTPAISTPAWNPSGAETLTIEFPEIKEPLPDVWGKGEELTILLRLNEKTRAGQSVPLDFFINNEAVAQPSTSVTGRVELLQVFPDKGNYELAAGTTDEVDNSQGACRRSIRIVDYREEIVNLFNALIEDFRGMGVKISEEFTPRKIQYLVEKANTGIPEKALDDVISCFEETDYSLHPITRKHYEIMYLAQREIKAHGFKPAAAV